MILFQITVTHFFSIGKAKVLLDYKPVIHSSDWDDITDALEYNFSEKNVISNFYTNSISTHLCIHVFYYLFFATILYLFLHLNWILLSYT